MKNIAEDINHILADWNPIGVNIEIAAEEYKRYVPFILKSITTRQELINCLENILTNELGLDYNSTNEEHLKDLEKICDKIFQSLSKESQS